MSMKLTQHQQAHDSIVPWGMLMLNVVSKEVDPSQLPEDKSEKQTAPWWKAKKWAYYCMNRLFAR
jgi:importin-7